MLIQRLSWAGIKITVGKTNILVDAMADPQATGYDDKPFAEGLIIPAGEPASIDYALITHRHGDHYDLPTLRMYLAPGGKVVCSRLDEERIQFHGFETVALGLHESFQAEDVSFTPVPAVDGLGDNQVSWVVEGGGKKIIHCGDTLWHGYWWKIAKSYAPFDAAFLPINGPLLNVESLQPPSGLPFALTPQQAVIAGRILGARLICPIHYGLLAHPGAYDEYPDAVATFVQAAQASNTAVQVVAPGEVLTW
jgi:L-ascorbate metabolism protein UlaG (beta-lactamase superfamily)